MIQEIVLISKNSGERKGCITLVKLPSHSECQVVPSNEIDGPKIVSQTIRS